MAVTSSGVMVGRFHLFPGNAADTIWISDSRSGEGGDFPKAEVRECLLSLDPADQLSRYFAERF